MTSSTEVQQELDELQDAAAALAAQHLELESQRLVIKAEMVRKAAEEQDGAAEEKAAVGAPEVESKEGEDAANEATAVEADGEQQQHGAGRRVE